MKYLFFDDMLTPKLITVVYWLALLGVLIAGIGSMFVPFSFSFMGLLRGLFFMAFGALMVRIGCETMIVLFKMNEALQDIRKRGNSDLN